MRKREKATFCDCISLGDCGIGASTMAIFIIGIFVGAICALFRLRVFVVVPLSALFAISSILSGVISHANPWITVIAVFGSFAAVQLPYAAVGLVLNFVRMRAVVPEMQSAIGHRLRGELDVPHTLTPELSALVARLP
jgi:hypothetical protein